MVLAMRLQAFAALYDLKVVTTGIEVGLFFVFLSCRKYLLHFMVHKTGAPFNKLLKSADMARRLRLIPVLGVSKEYSLKILGTVGLSAAILNDVYSGPTAVVPGSLAIGQKVLSDPQYYGITAEDNVFAMKELNKLYSIIAKDTPNGIASSYYKLNESIAHKLRNCVLQLSDFGLVEKLREKYYHDHFKKQESRLLRTSKVMEGLNLASLDTLFLPVLAALIGCICLMVLEQLSFCQFFRH